MFNSCHKLITQIRQDGLNGSNKERQLAKSVVAALVNSLQELSNNFKTSQGDYLRSMTSEFCCKFFVYYFCSRHFNWQKYVYFPAELNSREERSRQYFDNPWDVPSSASNQSNAAFLGLDEDRWEVDSSLDNIDQQFSNAASGNKHVVKKMRLVYWTHIS